MESTQMIFGDGTGIYLFLGFMAAAFLYVEMTRKSDAPPADEKKKS